MPRRPLLSTLTLGTALALAAPLPLTHATEVVDTAEPIIEIVRPPSVFSVWFTDTVDVRVATSDPGGSGVREVGYLLTGASEQAGTLTTEGGLIRVSAEGHTTVYVTAYDRHAIEAFDVNAEEGDADHDARQRHQHCKPHSCVTHPDRLRRQRRVFGLEARRHTAIRRGVSTAEPIE